MTSFQANSLLRLNTSKFDYGHPTLALFDSEVHRSFSHCIQCGSLIRPYFDFWHTLKFLKDTVTNAIMSRLDQLDAAAFAGCGLLLWIVIKLYSGRRRIFILPLPPGPKPLPFIGNTLDMPQKDDHLTLSKWGKQYGEVVLVSLLGERKVIFVNSAKAANELFEKRSRLYADRPEIPLITDTVGLDWNFAFFPYGEAWRLHRKIFVSEFGVRQANGYLGLQEKLTKHLLHRLLQTPEDFLNHLQLHSGNLIMNVIYSIDVESVENKHIQNILKVLKVISESTRPISYLIDMRRVSYFWPGVLGRKSIAEMRNDTRIMIDTPFEHVKTIMARGRYEPSYISNLLESGEDEDLIKKSAAVGYGAGSETSSASTSAFILAMVNYPEVQEKARVEINAVVGADRLPTVSDKDALPYVYAVYRETLRWHTVVPQGNILKIKYNRPRMRLSFVCARHSTLFKRRRRI
ncbi:cytochrome P450 [Schizopora paradoxa]|uniref:Cytochrome P450 n=1 Tax=Schizopora paradoxa TaxID=27342 RepID=A0A0H2S0Y9_9AGAM|nr:cytochrome P450 [Schizopora paradoxa]